MKDKKITDSDSYLAYTIDWWIKQNGTLVDDETKNQRIKTCESCPFYVEVEPVPSLKLMGCKKCGCPTETKAAMKTLERTLDAETGSPITPKEVASVNLRKKFGLKTKTEIIKCPENKWAK